MVPLTHWGLGNKTPWCHPIPLEEHLQLEQAALGQKVATQNITAFPGGWTWPACLYFGASADATERLQRHSGSGCSSSKIKGGQEAPQSSPLVGAGSPRCPGLTSTQKESWQGILDRQHNPHTPLQRQNTCEPLQKCTFVVLSLFVSVTSCSQLEPFSPCLGIL